MTSFMDHDQFCETSFVKCLLNKKELCKIGPVQSSQTVGKIFMKICYHLWHICMHLIEKIIVHISTPLSWIGHPYRCTSILDKVPYIWTKWHGLRAIERSEPVSRRVWTVRYLFLLLRRIASTVLQLALNWQEQFYIYFILIYLNYYFLYYI